MPSEAKRRPPPKKEDGEPSGGKTAASSASPVKRRKKNSAARADPPAEGAACHGGVSAKRGPPASPTGGDPGGRLYSGASSSSSLCEGSLLGSSTSSFSTPSVAGAAFPRPRVKSEEAASEFGATSGRALPGNASRDSSGRESLAPWLQLLLSTYEAFIHRKLSLSAALKRLGGLLRQLEVQEATDSSVPPPPQPSEPNRGRGEALNRKAFLECVCRLCLRLVALAPKLSAPEIHRLAAFPLHLLAAADEASQKRHSVDVQDENPQKPSSEEAEGEAALDAPRFYPLLEVRRRRLRSRGFAALRRGKAILGVLLQCVCASVLRRCGGDCFLCCMQSNAECVSGRVRFFSISSNWAARAALTCRKSCCIPTSTKARTSFKSAETPRSVAWRCCSSNISNK